MTCSRGEHKFNRRACNPRMQNLTPLTVQKDWADEQYACWQQLSVAVQFLPGSHLGEWLRSPNEAPCCRQLGATGVEMCEVRPHGRKRPCLCRTCEEAHLC